MSHSYVDFIGSDEWATVLLHGAIAGAIAFVAYDFFDRRGYTVKTIIKE